MAIILLASAQLTVCAEYIHGFFRYTVEDGSVTITAYRGNEEEVTVPSMIGGNPVNVIAAGAFANNSTVKTIHLPDTIMTVETGAFGPEQKVIYAAYETEPEQSTVTTARDPETEQNTVTDAPETEPDITPGDVDGDGEINNKDVVRLFRYVSVAEVVYNKKCDFNKDGKVNNKDVVQLFKKVSDDQS